ncbi:MAG: purine phosphorylase [Rhodospirillales bacterium]|nr:purine phosphorylase [Rhodospirillales bacterium]
MTRLGVITGLAAEADILSEFPSTRAPMVEIAGASGARAEAAALGLLAGGCGAILSFGVAGGLDPALAPGTAVIADAVVAPDGRRFPADAAWRDAVKSALAGTVPLAEGAIAGSDAPLLTAEAKRNFAALTGAIAVDMESHGAAKAAALKGAPFLAIRAVADTASRAIPPWVMDAILPDGGLAPDKIARALLPKPWMVWGLIGLARDQGRALGSLRRVATRLGPGFGLAL